MSNGGGSLTTLPSIGSGGTGTSLTMWKLWYWWGQFEVICVQTNRVNDWIWAKILMCKVHCRSGGTNVWSIQKASFIHYKLWCRSLPLIVIMCHVIFWLCQSCLHLVQCQLHPVCKASSFEGHSWGSKPMWGFQPVSTRKGECCVDKWIWLSYINSPRGSRVSQPFCHLFIKIQMYCSCSWLTHSVCYDRNFSKPWKPQSMDIQH